MGAALEKLVIPDQTIGQDLQQFTLPERRTSASCMGSVFGTIAEAAERIVSSIGKKLIVGSVAVAGIAGVAPKTDAAAMLLPGTTLPGQPYLDKWNEAAGQSLWVERTSSNGNKGYFSGFRINEYWGGTVAHGFNVSSGNTITYTAAGNGPKYNDPNLQGDVREIEYTVTHPLYGGSIGNGIDLTLFKFKDPMPGTDAVFGEAPSAGSVIDIYGFGRSGVQGGQQFQDGWGRGYQMIVDNFLTSQFDPQIYFQAGISPSTLNSVQLPGGSLANDSGSLGLEDGVYVGWAVAASGDLSGVSTTTFGKFSPSALEFIDQTIVPEPNSLFILGLGLAGLASRRLRRLD